MAYEVELEIFEGPMDLLLNLIKENEIDIYDIPIGYLTEKYLNYMRQAEEWNLEISTDFLLMAATLLEIKSKMLLPARKSAPEEEDEEEAEDPRAELVERLVEYRQYKEAAAQFRQLESISSKIFCKSPEDFSPFLEEQKHQNLTMDMLCKTFDQIVRQHLKKIELKHQGEIYKEHFTVESALLDISAQISLKKVCSFSDIVGEAFSLEHIITYFLALLELIRQRKIIVVQIADFEEITITRVDTVE